MVCDGPGLPEGKCDCDGRTLDCDGNCGGESFVDECGTCNGAGINWEVECDCAHHVYDECDICDGNGVVEPYCDCGGNRKDCDGVCGGSAGVDECGVCGGTGV